MKESPLILFGDNMETKEIELDIRNLESLEFTQYLELLEQINFVISDRDGCSTLISGLPNTELNINLLPNNVAKKFNRYRTILLAESMRANTVDGQAQIIGIMQADVCIRGFVVPDVLWCSAVTDKLLVGRKVCPQTGLIAENIPHVNCKNDYINTVATKLPLAVGSMFCQITLHQTKRS